MEYPGMVILNIAMLFLSIILFSLVVYSLILAPRVHERCGKAIHACMKIIKIKWPITNDCWKEGRQIQHIETIVVGHLGSRDRHPGNHNHATPL